MHRFARLTNPRPFAGLPKRRPPVLAVVAASVVLGAVCAVWSVSTVSLIPPGLSGRNLQIGGATTMVLVDLPDSTVTDPTATPFTYATLIARAHLLARLMATPPALQYIGQIAGIDPDRIAAVATTTVGVPSALTDAGSEERAHQLVLAADPYRLEVQSRTDVPVIDIYTQAPSVPGAERLADAAIGGLGDYLRALAAGEQFAGASMMRLEQLGPARGGVINSGAALKIAALTFLFAFALSCTLLLALARLLPAPARGRPDDTVPSGRPPGWPSPRPAIALSMRGGAVLGPPDAVTVPGSAGALVLPRWQFDLPIPRIPHLDGEWPRTTRVLPWMLAGFMAILWLVPFDSIALKVSLPVDLKLDRLVLPLIVATWALALAVGGRGAPRIRLTRIHVAVGVFTALAFLSVLVNATALNQSLELDTSVKQLPLLLAYLSLFFMVASVVRRAEVHAFLTYTLVLALICAIGMLVEYKTQYNVFFSLSSKLLPGAFSVAANTEGYDSAGRLATHGPTAHPLAAASILAMALPIAIVRITEAQRWRQRLLYWIAAAILMLAVFATQRKTAVIAPAAAVLTLACFRPRAMLRLAPMAVAAAIAVLIISPGTFEPVIKQFSGGQLSGGTPSTLSARASRYDAIRPDVFTHLVLGRGYGSYQPLGHRILDSEILLRLIETGVLGLTAFLMLGASVLLTARAAILTRHRVLASPALTGAAAAAVFLTVATLFDSLSFPQVPYIFLYMAALVAVVIKPPEGHTSSPQ